MTPALIQVCAEVAEDCADSCDEHSDGRDGEMERCAEACRDLAEWLPAAGDGAAGLNLPAPLLALTGLPTTGRANDYRVDDTWFRFVVQFTAPRRQSVCSGSPLFAC